MTTKKEKAAYALVGRKGGRAIAKKLGKKGMAALGKKGAAKRWPRKTAAKKPWDARAAA